MPLNYFLVLSVVLFVLGAATVMTRRNAIVAFMGVEVMFNAANLAFLTFARQQVDVKGHTIAFFVMAVAAAEAAVGLAIIISVFRKKATVNLDELRELRG